MCVHMRVGVRRHVRVCVHMGLHLCVRLRVCFNDTSP